VSASIARQLAELASQLEAEQKPKYLRAVSPRDGFRSKVHALVVDVVALLETMGYSRNRIATIFDVHPVTLKDYIEAGDKQRCQIPGWLFAAFAKLPSEAWELVQREMLSWRTNVREVSNGE
jgi:hypothetical protein